MNTDKAKARLEDILIGKNPDLDTVIVVLTQVLETVEVLEHGLNGANNQLLTMAKEMNRLANNLTSTLECIDKMVRTNADN